LRIGVISDTHGLFDPAVPKHFRRVDAIIHAGDIGKLEVIDRLQAIAPVFAVEGNNDSFRRFSEQRIERMENYSVLVRHIFGELHQLGKTEMQLLRKRKPDVVIFGHSHRPYKQMLEGTLLFNPGSAGPRRFSLPRTLGILNLSGSGIRARVIYL